MICNIYSMILLLALTDSTKIDIIASREMKTILENSSHIQSFQLQNQITSNYFYIEKSDVLSIKETICSFNISEYIVVIYSERWFEIVITQLKNQGFAVLAVPINMWKIINKIYNEWNVGFSYSSLAKALNLLFPEDVWKEFVIFFDSSSDKWLINNIVKEASQNRRQSVLFNLEGQANNESLNFFMMNSVRKKIRHLYIISNNTLTTKEIITMAKNQRIMQQNYFWVIINPNIIFDDIMETLESTDIPNIGVIKTFFESSASIDCSIQRCSKYQFLGSLMASLKLFMEIEKYMVTFFQNNSNICQNSTEKSLFQQHLTKFQETNNFWKVFQKDKAKINVFSTKSVDVTPEIPNVFNYSTTFKLAGSIDTKNEIWIFKEKNVYLNTFEGWNNKTLYLCSPTLTPALNFLGNGTYFPLEKTTGVIFEMLKILSVQMKFVPILYEAQDKLWGGRIRNISTLNYTGCVGEIFNRKSLLGASVFTPNFDRKLGIDFSVLFMDESNCASLQFPKPSSRTWQMFRPLYWTTWLLIIISLIMNSVISFLFSFFSPLSAWNLKLPFSIVDEIKFREHLWNIIGSFLMQGQDFYPYSMSSRTILAIWWLFTIIICSGYSADLTSFLTVGNQDETLVTLDQLANRSDLEIIVPKDTTAALTIEKTDYWVYQKIKSRMKYVQTIDECPRAILEESATNLVCITDLSPVLYVVKRNCAKIYIIPQTFNTISMGFALQYDAPFEAIMNKYIRKILDNGQMEKWIDKYWSNNDPNISNCDNNNNNQDSAPAIDLEGVGGIFICIGVFNAISVLFLLFEIIWVKKFNLSLSSFPWQP